MPRKPSVVVDVRSPEKQWFDAQRETLIKIHEFENMSDKLQKKADRYAYLVEGYDIVIARQLGKLLQMDVNDPELEKELKELHVSRRYKAYWEDLRKMAQGICTQNAETIQALRRLLASAPYPGERPQLESPPEEMEADAGCGSRVAGDGAHVVRTETAPLST